MEVDPTTATSAAQSSLDALDRLAELSAMPSQQERIRILNLGVLRGWIQYPDSMTPIALIQRGRALEAALEAGAPNSVVKACGGLLYDANYRTKKAKE